jgi:hypothetical protein
MSKRGISGQLGCVLSFRHNFLFGGMFRKLCLELNLAPAFFGEGTPQKRLDLTSFKEYLKYFGVRV